MHKGIGILSSLAGVLLAACGGTEEITGSGGGSGSSGAGASSSGGGSGNRTFTSFDSNLTSLRSTNFDAFTSDRQVALSTEFIRLENTLGSIASFDGALGPSSFTGSAVYEGIAKVNFSDSRSRGLVGLAQVQISFNSNSMSGVITDFSDTGAVDAATDVSGSLTVSGGYSPSTRSLGGSISGQVRGGNVSLSTSIFSPTSEVVGRFADGIEINSSGNYTQTGIGSGTASVNLVAGR